METTETMTNEQRFTEVYTKHLTAAHIKHPEQYASTVEQIPLVVSRMVPSLKAGTAANSPTIKATCRELGIKSTYAAIKEFLNG